jgi:16S rRNA C967 or C1407 C5-methylase (RsmB/RsmF family)/NOL1/NOP2/fmu family ribosome biogenesis protein
MIPSEIFLSSLKDCEGFCLQDFVAAHEEETAVSIRVNTSKLAYANTSDEDALHSAPSGIFSNQNNAGHVPWCGHAFYLKSRPSFTLDPHIHAGVYYVQEASSMFIHHALLELLAGQIDLKALDLCASPGGKTTLLASIPNFRLVLANEIIQTRVPALYENVVKWGAPHVFVSNNDPRDFEKVGGMFDVVLVDAPCSGSGLFRKDEDAARSWNPALVDFCAMRQKRVLADAYKALAENGIMVYSTCSFSLEENELNLDFFLDEFDAESIQVSLKNDWGVVETRSKVHSAFGYRFYPDKLKGEGFFCAFIRKKSSSSTVGSLPKVVQYKPGRTDEIIKKWISSTNDLNCFLMEKEVFVFERNNEFEHAMFKQFLHLRKSGVRVGTLMRDELIPNHELSMSTIYSKEISQVEVNYDQAIRYLRKEDMLKEIQEKGWIMITYRSVPLGWIKSLPGRINNYYPMNWRISMRK